MPKNLTQAEWIERARAVHGERYGYEKVVYETSLSIVSIICQTHGEFQQRAGIHTHGKGCPQCGREQGSKSLEVSFAEFLKRASEIHGTRFSYIESSYRRLTDDVTIVCKEHGEFSQQAARHLISKHGCPACALQAKTARKVKPRLTQDEWLIKAAKVHGDRYDYSRAQYILSNEKVEIGCPVHGWFWQAPNAHMAGRGCHKCQNVKFDFIERAKEVHGDRYDYSKTVHTGQDKVVIICKAHGEFVQSPPNHLNGSGCPECAKADYGKLSPPAEAPSKEVLLERFLYEPDTGKLFNRKTKSNAKSGKEAGWTDKLGYRHVCINMTSYQVSRLIPVLEGLVVGTHQFIDHINGVVSDNRIENLRVVDRRQNMRNQVLYKNNKTGYAGIRKEGNRYVVYINGPEGQYIVGRFKTLEEAVEARKAAENSHNYHPNHGKSRRDRSKA